jgi:hypothetical protein
MMFTAPLVLLGLAALPGLYFLLRMTPPEARKIAFPPLALLRGLEAPERTPHQMPLWLLLLRLLAGFCLIIGLAGPSLHPAPALPGRGPVFLVIDNGWAAAADWAARRDAALRLVEGAARAGRGVAILATARNAANQAPAIQGVMTAQQAGQIIAAMAPEPWPADRAGSAAALALAPAGTKIYLSDGITDGPGFSGFLRALRPDRVFAPPAAPALLLPGGLSENGDLVVRLAAPRTGARVLAETLGGSVLAAQNFAPDGVARIDLPLGVATRVEKLVLDGPPSAGGTLLLDPAAHAALIGLAAGSATADAPYLGPLFFIRRALPPGDQVVTGSLSKLLADRPGVLILADLPLSDSDLPKIQNYIAGGGVVIRFAGPLTAAAPDALSPDALLAGDRRLGGALTWAAPQNLAAFPASSPFAGLAADGGVTISRQILADPTQLDEATVWASLHDGTPLILGAAQGRGVLAQVLTSANADWSNLALSGLYPAVLARLVALSHGVPGKGDAVLPAASAMDGFGSLGPVAVPAHITPAAVLGAMVSPVQPPGFYGSGGARLALNLGGHLPPVAAADLPGAAPFTGPPPPRDFGPWLLAAALALLAVDLFISLLLRGKLRVRAFALLLLIFIAPSAHAQNAALSTTLAYVMTGDPAVDKISADGLANLSVLVSAHSSAQLGAPVGVDPAADDLTLYPLVYWPLTAAAPPPPPAACAALASYMQFGGLLVIDTQGGDASAAGSGAGFAPGAAAAFSRDTACLNLPPLQPLTPQDVVAHCFYIVTDFPGRFDGAPVLQASPAARDADGVTPVIVTQNDWAGAWAADAAGNPEQTPIPGGEAQRQQADWFGTNLVIYALTGNYKADQADLPGLLDRLGQ